MPQTIDAEKAVRQYLLFLEDPDTVVDQELVARLEAEVERTTDPIDKLKALSELERAKSLDGDMFKSNFISHAKRWATANEVPVSSFRQLGVPESVLRSAGLLDSRSGRMMSPTVPRQRAKGVSGETIKAHILTRTGQFTMSQVTEAAGGSPMTLRKAFEELIRDGRVRRIGPDPTYKGRGRAPILYEIVDT